MWHVMSQCNLHNFLFVTIFFLFVTIFFELKNDAMHDRKMMESNFRKYDLEVF
jgi:hypothetical protein